MILAGERVVVLGLIAMPAVEIGGLVRELTLHLEQRLRIDHEAEKGEIVLVDEGPDLRDGEPVLLHMEAQVAAAAHVEEIGRLHEPAAVRKVAVEQFLPEAANVARATAIAALLDQLADCHDLLPPERTIEAEIHETARSQQRKQHAPARERIVEMVQHAASLDHIERACQFTE